MLSDHLKSLQQMPHVLNIHIKRFLGGVSMKLKKLAIANGIVGLAGGIILLLGGWIILSASAISDNTLNVMIALFLALKVAIFVLGIVGLVKFNKTPILTKSPSVLLIVGGAIALVPFMGWIGGIVAIVGGSLYLAGLKKFHD